ncbi:type I CRISPR-associated protein Cas7 (plasmid) [Aneurinibacillus sp. Ricciae_BoGa-3]|uniref:type I CRISPR-associated protein Cas7 n=1 Tax=Aneurinibacillus sp. Ricciae_BoGa-3 TaxID=3022697 RepID=UPI0023424E1C|nr:type I CRISPR-associated protein Cas7 [Aneurinibacillus sp. Ricciae_BoGa-3]WCK57158.1 type I CRISPR-associated protein Cas7 [Aneurinibacillus sp. Ricciae_BoGa-3]
MKKSNKVYGVLGIASYMSNFNADFTGNPRKFGDMYFASNVAGKYPIRAFWNKLGERVFFIKSMKVDKEKAVPRLMDERYEFLFEKKLKPKTSREIIKDLFSCVDVMNFGGTFASKENNISITGAVQLTEGINKYELTETIREEILSPFVNSNKEDSDQTTLGSRSIVDEAHYFYGFSVNPLNYKEFEDVIEGFEGYTQEAFDLYKEGCLYGVNELQSMSKVGSENEFALFVELKNHSRVSMANLHQYVSFENKENQRVIKLTRLMDYLKGFKNHVASIEVYFNPYTTSIIGESTELDMQTFSILDKSVINR